jgi:hypothetical protein
VRHTPCIAGGAVKARPMASSLADLIHRQAPPLILGALLCSLSVHSGFRRDEVACEEAVARLIECCPERGFNLSCYHDNGCGRGEVPDLELDHSNCIRDLLCTEINQRGLCEIHGYESHYSPIDAGIACQ